ncbi:MAG: hypothetical protein COC15_01045, partial [Legionellales bacterium]
VTVLRNKKLLQIKIPLQETVGFNSVVTRHIYDKLPSYYIHSGLVFQPLTQNYLETYGQDWMYIAPKKLLHYFVDANFTKRKQVIILSNILADAVTVGYPGMQNSVVETVNGIKVDSLATVIKAIEKNSGNFDIIRFENGGQVVLDSKQARARHKKLLKKYYITSDRSRDLQ